MQNKIRYFIFLMIIILFTSNCKKKSEDFKSDIETTIVKEKVKMDIIKPEVKEVKVFGKEYGGNQYAGVSYEKNEFYVIDHIIWKKKGKLLLKGIDIDTGKENFTKSLTLGDYLAPDAFDDKWADVDIPVLIDYVSGNYYLTNYNKIAFMNKDKKIKDATFFYYGYCNYHLEFLSFFKTNFGLKLLLSRNTPRYQRKSKIRMIERRFEIMLFNVTFKNKLKAERIINNFRVKTDMMALEIKNGKYTLYSSYFVPYTSGLVIGNKIYYAININQGYYVYDINTKKTKFIKLLWLTPKTFSDEDAYKIGTYKIEDWGQKEKYKRAGTKHIYRSYKGRIYFLKIVKIGKNNIGIVSDMDSDKKEIKIDIINSSGDYQKSIILPFGSDFANKQQKYSHIRSFFIDYKRGLYVYGDRTKKEWDNVVRYCRFGKAKKQEENKRVE